MGRATAIGLPAAMPIGSQPGRAMGVDLGKPGVQRSAPEGQAASSGVMTTEDVRAVIEAAADVHQMAPMALRLAAASGARRSELAGLRWDRVDDDRIAIDRVIGVVRQRGEKGRPTLVEQATKTLFHDQGGWFLTRWRDKKCHRLPDLTAPTHWNARRDLFLYVGRESVWYSSASR